MNSSSSASVTADRTLWIRARPLLALVAAAFLGLTGAVVLATIIRPLLQIVVDLVAAIASLINWSSPRVTADVVSTVDLGFGVLGGSILLATIKDTLKELKSVLIKWTTVDNDTLFSAAFALFLSFLALGLSVYGLANARKFDGNQAQLVTYPMFLTTSETVGFMPIYFANATLRDEYWKEPYVSAGNQIAVPVDPGIWDGGTSLSSEDQTLINSFLAELRRCASRASSSNSIRLRVSAYASTREFMDDQEKIHPQSDQLNIQAANDRAEAVYDFLVERQDAVLSVSPLAQYSSLPQMHDARLSIDRLPGHELLRQEDLARRADITIVAAPGCKGIAQLASKP